MKQIVEKVKNALKTLESNKGSLLTIGALFLREDPLEKWDVIVSASWLDDKNMESYGLVGSCIRNVLESSELVQFSRVVILDTEDPIVSYLQSLDTIKNGGFKELDASELSDKFQFSIKKAYLLRS